MSRVMALMLVMALGLGTTPAAASAALDDRDQVAQQIDQQGATELLRAYVAKLPIGSTVKVTPKQGRSFKGVLMVVDQDTIVIKPKARIARPERQIALREIDFVELQERNGASTMKAVGIGIASAVGTFLGLILVAVAVSD